MDARLPDRALSDADLEGVSDVAFRIWVNGLAYIMAQRTDGRVGRRALRHLHPDGPKADAAAELVAAGIWARDGDGWLNVKFQESQTTAKEAERLREQARQRSAKYRQSKRDASRLDPVPRQAAKSTRHAPSRVTQSDASSEDDAVGVLSERNVARDDSSRASSRDFEHDDVRHRQGAGKGTGEAGNEVTQQSESLPMLPGESEQEYQRRFDAWEHRGGDDDADREFIAPGTRSIATR